MISSLVYNMRNFKFCLYGLMLVILAQEGSGMGPPMGPPGKINILALKKCAGNNDFDFTLMKNDKGHKCVKATFDLKRDYNEKFMFHAKVHQWTGSQWKKNMMVYDGGMCEFVKKNLDRMRKVVYQDLKIPGACPAKAGKYNQVMCFTEKDMDLASTFYGKYQMEVKITDDKKAQIACFLSDFESNAK